MTGRFGLWGYIILDSWEIPVAGIALLGLSIVLLVATYAIVKRVLDKRARFKGEHPDLYNGIRFIIRLVIGFVLVSLAFYFLNIEWTYIVLVYSIIATAVTFGSIRAINNFISGVWITFTKPFAVGDYIDINGIEGVVVGISLNYTKILDKTSNITFIPNVDCLGSTIINYSVSIKWLKKQVASIEEMWNKTQERLAKNTDKFLEPIIEHQEAKIHHLWMRLKEFENLGNRASKMAENGGQEGDKYASHRNGPYISKDKLVRYTFTLQLKKEPARNAMLLDEVCKKWSDEFEMTPDWKIVGLDSHVRYMFFIYTPNPMDIINYFDDFVKDIYRVIYNPEISY